MQYWNSVLNEVVFRNDSESFLFTQQGRLEHIEDEEIFLAEDFPIVIKPKEPRDLRTYYLSGDFADVYLTKREAECIFWIVQEYTIPQTADIMGLSARTVEFYVKNLKLKLCCKNKKELIEKILKTTLLQQLEKDGLRLVKH